MQNSNAANGVPVQSVEGKLASLIERIECEGMTIAANAEGLARKVSGNGSGGLSCPAPGSFSDLQSMVDFIADRIGEVFVRVNAAQQICHQSIGEFLPPPPTVAGLANQLNPKMRSI
jgi:hypothetical protein